MKLVLLRSKPWIFTDKSSNSVKMLSKGHCSKWEQKFAELCQENGNVGTELYLDILKAVPGGIRSFEEMYLEISDTQGNKNCCYVETKFPLNRGNVFRKLYDYFYDEVSVSIFLKMSTEGGNFELFSMAEGVKIDRESYSCVWESKPFQPGCFSIFQLEIIAHIPDNIIPRVYLEDPSTRIPAAQKVLDEGTFFDAAITVAHGVQIQCHKAFLFVSSPIFKAMFQTAMVESRTNSIHMPDASEMGVKAFLQYLYYDDLTLAKNDIEIAFELVRIAHKYDIPRLEALSIVCLSDIADEDYSCEQAFKMYQFARGSKSFIALKAKTIPILKSKLDELEKMPEYTNLFQKGSEVAMELCMDLAKAPLKRKN